MPSLKTIPRLIVLNVVLIVLLGGSLRSDMTSRNTVPTFN